jgi:CRP-like cAMP-binding protein
MNLDAHKFKRLIPIESLPLRSQRELAKRMKIEQFKKGAKVFTSGDTDDDFVYLQEGQLELVANDNKALIIDADSEDARSPLSNLKPRRYSATVASPEATILRFPGDIIENLLAMGEAPSQPEDGLDLIEVYEFKTPEDQSWMMALLNTNAFRRLPAANISNLFKSFEEIQTKAGEVIVNYGEVGDYYYVIRAGRCKVWRPTDTGRVELAQLEECDSFGEEALISERPRNASVEMITDGALMRLSKEQFTTLLKEPLIRPIRMKEAKRLLKAGAFKVDVRTENEYTRSGIRGSINLPLHMLRGKAKVLDHGKKYILFCNNGVRSEAACFIMASLGFDVYFLRGGLNSVIAERQRRSQDKEKG